MFSDIALFLFNMIFTLFGASLVLRTWMQIVGIPENPISQGLFQISDWLILPLKRIIPDWFYIDCASVIAIWLTALVYLSLMFTLIGVNLFSLFPMILMNAVLIALKWAINLVLWATILYTLMSWVNPTSPTMIILDMLLAPFLDLLRNNLPNLGIVDLSPMALVVLVQLLLIIVNRISTPIMSLIA